MVLSVIYPIMVIQSWLISENKRAWERFVIRIHYILQCWSVLKLNLWVRLTYAWVSIYEDFAVDISSKSSLNITLYKMIIDEYPLISLSWWPYYLSISVSVVLVPFSLINSPILVLLNSSSWLLPFVKISFVYFIRD